MDLPGRSPGGARITYHGSESRRSAMTLNDVMTPDVEVIAPEATLQ
jgi:hypothetical protein